MAAKRTAELIPLCHPLPLTHVDVTLRPAADGYDIEARVRTTAQTGVEMEALTAVAVAALTIYDMVKAVDKAMVIADIRLVEEARRAGGRLLGVMLILILIHSPFAMWNIPLAHMSGSVATFPVTRSFTPRTDEEAVDSFAKREVAFSAQINVEQLRAAPAPDMDPQSGGRHRRHAVSGDGGEPGRHHEFARALGRHDRRTCAGGDAGALPPSAARLRAAGRASMGAGRDRRAPGNRTIAGSRVVVVGAGAIGGATATRMHALGASVTLIRRRAGPAGASGDYRCPRGDRSRRGAARRRRAGDRRAANADHTWADRPRRAGADAARRRARQRQPRRPDRRSRAGRRLDARPPRRRRARRLSPGAAAARPSAVESPQRAHHAAHVGVPHRSLGRRYRPVRGQPAPLRPWRAAAQRRGQAGGY